jgi:signal transduction histidine kinase
LCRTVARLLSFILRTDFFLGSLVLASVSRRVAEPYRVAVRADRLVNPRDALLAVVLLAVAQTELLTSDVHFNRVASVVAAAVITSSVALRRTFPVVALVGVLGANVVHDIVAGVPAPGLADPPYSFALSAAWLIAVYSVPAYGGRVQAIAGAVLPAAAAIGFTFAGGGSHPVSEVLAALLLSVAVPWLAGFARAWYAATVAARLETNRLHAERERAEVEVAQAERTRIARELHDIVAHALSVVVVQAAAERRQLDSRHEQTAEVFSTIENTSRTALGELRRLLGTLRAPDDPPVGPQPQLSDLGEVVATVRGSGIIATLRVEGPARDLPPGIELSAYRVAQEALTNVVKHADASHADVIIRFKPTELEVEIRDDGRGSVVSASAGFGLVGARERVAFFGGDFDATPVEQGGFRVCARFPLPGV